MLLFYAQKGSGDARADALAEADEEMARRLQSKMDAQVCDVCVMCVYVDMRVCLCASYMQALSLLHFLLCQDSQSLPVCS